MFVWQLVDPVAQRYGDQVGDVIGIGLVACIYMGMDVVLWTVIRSGRRGAALRRRGKGEQSLGILDRIDLISALIVSHAFPLWALITAAGLYFGAGFKIEFYEPSIRATIAWGSMILALPILPLLGAVRQSFFNDPTTRAVVLSAFVVACVIIDLAVKRQIRKRRAQRVAQRRSDEAV